jgi:hypothetical protein
MAGSAVDFGLCLLDDLRGGIVGGMAKFGGGPAAGGGDRNQKNINRQLKAKHHRSRWLSRYDVRSSPDLRRNVNLRPHSVAAWRLCQSGVKGLGWIVRRGWAVRQVFVESEAEAAGDNFGQARGGFFDVGFRKVVEVLENLEVVGADA